MSDPLARFLCLVSAVTSDSESLYAIIPLDGTDGVRSRGQGRGAFLYRERDLVRRREGLPKLAASAGRSVRPRGWREGSRGRGIGANPEELLLASVAACFLNTWAIFLAKLKVAYAEPWRSARNLPEGRSLALRERQRREGIRRAAEAVLPSREPVRSRSRASESDGVA